MKTKKIIAIIGATGAMGSWIASRLSRDGYRLILMSKDARKLQALQDSLSMTHANAIVESGDCAREVSWQADLIVLTTPYAEQREVAEKIREVATGKIVISVTIGMDASSTGAVTSNGISAAEELQRLLPYSKVAKTFNTLFAHDVAAHATTGRRPDAFIAANNGDALEVVAEIVAAAGLNPVVVGDLSVSGRLERIPLMSTWTGGEEEQRLFERELRIDNKRNGNDE